MLPSLQSLQQGPGLLQILRVETFGEPLVDRSEKFTSFYFFALLLPQASKTRGGAEFPGFSALLMSNDEGLLKTRFRFFSF